MFSPRLLAADGELDFFEKKIRPVLVDKCYRCHGADAKEVKGGLRLDSREALSRGGDSGAAVIPGKPEASLLLSALRYESFEMPPEGRLPDEVIADFEKWIRMGAADPREGEGAPLPRREINWDEAREHWSFQNPQRHPLPATQSPARIRQPIDAFILARLEHNGLTPATEADRRTLLRRVSFDLTGLPPSAADVEDFLRDDSPTAYEQVVDRLLSSPQYGARWARFWLDLARFGEDQAHIVGNDRSLCYPNAFLYRDWVIGVFNEDLPYDEFVRRQLAADLIHPDDPAAQVALGFIGLGPKYYRRSAPEVMADEWEDRVDTVTRGLLGLTVACARCHHHKYDPITTEDYYGLAGVFASTEMFNRPFDDQIELGKDGQAKDPGKAWHVIRETKPKDLAVHIRGDATKLGPVVPRRFLQVLSESEPVPLSEGSGRRDLAEAIVSRDNPLTARVLVNRVWDQFFGRPLVPTMSNFGSLGERPSHPELLDDLAVRFIESGWSLKGLHRELVLSATYRQSSDTTARQAAVDPANVWLSRMNRRRLSVEAWRDGVLASVDRLDLRIGGPSIDPQDPVQRRRTVYAEVSRLQLNPLLSLFDFPDPNAHSEGRMETTTPLQKLFMLNSPFMVQQAKVLADQLMALPGDDREKIEAAFREVLVRTPTEQERELAAEFLHGCSEEGAARWMQLAQVLLASNELLLLD